MFFGKQRVSKLKPWVPTARDISPTEGEDLDERSALEHFLGQDVQDILAQLRDDWFEVYQEDLMFMGRRGFAYYLEAVWLYVQEWVDEDFGCYEPYLLMFMESRMRTEGATEFGIKHYAMSAEEMAANPHARAIREHCIAELERLLAAGGTKWFAPAELREHLERWRGLF